MSLGFEFQEQLRAIEENIQKEKQTVGLTSEISQFQDEVREGYVPEKKAAPDYGEPWTESIAWNTIQTRRAETVIYDASDMKQPYRTRAVACVNACAGMADPSAEIEKLKECRARYIEVCTNLQECAHQHNIGLGGERLDEIVCAEIQVLREKLEDKKLMHLPLVEQLQTAKVDILAMREAIKNAFHWSAHILNEAGRQWQAAQPLPDVASIEAVAQQIQDELKTFIKP